MALRRAMSGGAAAAARPVYESAAELRAACRSGSFRGQTAGQAPGCVQANLVVLPRRHARDFEAFCAGNAAPCPLLEVTAPGAYEAARLAPGSDLRRDLPKYRVWVDGELKEERDSITDLWTDEMQAFLLGCSFSWEDLLAAQGHTPRHVEEGKNVPMFDTSIALKGAGPFQGNMVVSMRPYPPADIEEVSSLTAAFPAAHGPPVQVGDPGAIGVRDCRTPDYGDAVELREGEVPVFWACGVTPANALRSARLPLAITHAPGHMFVADARNEDLKTWAVPGKWAARPGDE